MTATFHLKVPQMGEGLRTVKVVRLLKSVGDWISEDEDVIEVETEKAVLGISSSTQGYLSKIVCQPGEIVSVGAVLLEIGQEPFSNSARDVPSSQEVPKDVKATNPANISLKESRTLPDKQIELIRHMEASREIVITASLELSVDWSCIDLIRKSLRGQNDRKVPSSTAIVTWAVSRSMQEFEKFRWKVAKSGNVECSSESLIGIALSGDDDTLEIPVLKLSEQASIEEVGKALEERVSRYKAGENVSGYHSLVISDMSTFQVRRAQPIVVYPAVATLFIGTPYQEFDGVGHSRRVSNFALSFDHRVVNGVYAARFLTHVNKLLAKCASQFSATPERNIEDDRKIAA